MNIEKFIEERPFLYHLTSQSNAKRISVTRKIYSTNELIKMSGNKSYLPILKKKRNDHAEIIINGESYWLRDQKPISEKALAKCLTDGWRIEDFLFHLNDRVFMWPTLDRLYRHYNRYVQEKPIIFRFPTKDLLELNSHVLFSRLNSGATRANSYLGGKPPARGAETFLPAEKFQHTVREVAEVTFPVFCNINVDFGTSLTPEGSYREFKK